MTPIGGIVVALAIGLVSLSAQAEPARLPAPILAGDATPRTSTSGTYELSWTIAHSGTLEFELVETLATGESRPIYRGPDRSTVQSGLLDGARDYRVRAIDADGAHGPWSESRRVVVHHHSLELALWFLGLGGAVFLATASFIVRSHLRLTRRPA